MQSMYDEFAEGFHLQEEEGLDDVPGAEEKEDDDDAEEPAEETEEL